MNPSFSDMLHAATLPGQIAIPAGTQLVARLCGLDFEGLFSSEELGFRQPFDARFAKLLVRTASHLLGGDSGARLAFLERTQFSLALDPAVVAKNWDDALKLRDYLVGLASTQLSAQLGAEALFGCELHALADLNQLVSYFAWRQEKAADDTLDAYCRHALKGQGVERLLPGMAAEEKREILGQNEVDWQALPAWQRVGSVLVLSEDGKVEIKASLPEGEAFVDAVRGMLGA
ncbi:MAG: hypothetical protein H6707_11985 [Deltaproteobacteria bacterium]|nr:hypothetical protein [Deltaproteobacteria bacterium]